MLSVVRGSSLCLETGNPAPGIQSPGSAEHQEYVIPGGTRGPVCPFRKGLSLGTGLMTWAGTCLGVDLAVGLWRGRPCSTRGQ